MPYGLHQDQKPQYYSDAVYTGSGSHNKHHHLQQSPVLSSSHGPASVGVLSHPRSTSPVHYSHSDDVDMQPLDLSVKHVRCEPLKKRPRLESCEQDGDRFEGFIRTNSFSNTGGSNRVARQSPYPHHTSARSRSPNPQTITSIPSRSPQDRSESPYYSQRHTPGSAHYNGGSVALGCYSFHPSHPSAALPSPEGSSYPAVPDSYDSSKSQNYFIQYQAGIRQDYTGSLKGESSLCDEEKPCERDIYNDTRTFYSKSGDGAYTRSPVYSQQLPLKPVTGERVESKETELSKLLASNQTSDRIKSEASFCKGKPFYDSNVSPVESAFGDSRWHHHPEEHPTNDSSFKSTYQLKGDSKFSKEVYHQDATLSNCRVSPSFTHTTILNLIQKPNPVPSGYPSPPVGYTFGSPASGARQSPTNASHIVEQSSPSNKENPARHKSRKSLLLARTAGFFQTPVDKIKNDEKLIHMTNSEDRTDDSTKISLLDFWISKILMERSEEALKKPCSVDYIRRTVDGQRKIRISLVDLIEMQVEQSLKA